MTAEKGVKVDVAPALPGRAWVGAGEPIAFLTVFLTIGVPGNDSSAKIGELLRRGA